MDETVSTLHKLIYNLKSLKTNGSDMVSSIYNFDLLISALDELDAMIEMESLKDSIVKQIKFLLINRSVNSNTNRANFDGHMLHTVIYGPPGVGKTEVCKILVKIWLALGVIKKPEPTAETKHHHFQMLIAEHINNLIQENIFKTKEIEKLQMFIYDIKDDLKIIDSPLDNFQYLLKKLRRLMVKPSKSYSTPTLYDHVTTRPEENVSGIIDKLSLEIRKIQASIRQQADKQIPIDNFGTGSSFSKIVNPANLPDSINSANMSKTTNYDKKEDKYDGKTDKKDESSPTTISSSGIEAPIRKTSPTLNILPVTPSLPPSLPPSSTSIPKIIPKTPPNTPGSDNTTVNLSAYVKIVSRDDFVAPYLGQTAIKTETLLRESLGKVLFIDEAYSLVNDDKDSFGKEAATVLNRFMSEYPEELIVIFAGYKDLMAETIFKYQPGLKSRCAWTFEVDGYSEKGLADIFKRQINKSDWLISDDINLHEFFKKNVKDFPAYGRDTNRLVFYSKICYTESVFDNNSNHNKTITTNVLNSGLEYLQENKVKDNEPYDNHIHMYL